MTPWVEILSAGCEPSYDLEAFVEGRGASEEKIEWLQRTIFAPIDEVWGVIGSPSEFDARGWPMPQHPLPPSYLDLLRFCNGIGIAEVRTIECFALEEVRDMMLSYHVPDYWPLAVPFAMNGGGAFYAFDMREPPDADGEFPIVMCDAGAMGWDDGSGTRKIADSLEQCFRDAMKPSGSD